jgi:hypothetical protein
VVTPDGEQLALRTLRLLVQILDQRTICRAVTAWPFSDPNAAYSISVTSASEIQAFRWSSQIAWGTGSGSTRPRR